MARSKARKMADGEMKLTRDGSSKLEANATGVDVTGTVTADGLSIDGNGSTITTTSSSGDQDLLVFARPTHGEVGKIRRNANNLQILGESNLTLAADYDNDHTGSSSNVIIETDGTEKMRVDGGGRVGIGTTSPSRKLSVQGGDFEVKDGSSSMAFSEYQNGAYLWLDGSNGDFAGGDYFNIAAVDNTRLSFGYAGNASISLLSNGRLGIGTTTPTYPLEVANGTPVIRLKDTNNTGSGAIGWLEFTDSNDTRLGYLGYGSSGSNTMFIRQEQDANIDFYVNGTRKGHINSSEVVLAGRKVNRDRRTFEGYFNTGPSSSTAHIMTYSRHWWGSGNTRIHLYEMYYGPNSYYRMYELNGHTRTSHGGGAPTAYLRENYGGHCTVTVANWDSSNQRADIRVNMPAYRGVYVVIETFNVISSSEPTGASNYLWIPSTLTEVV